MHKPIKKLGQNFLRDNTVVDLMVASLDVQHTDTLIEIGPGEGVVTRALAARAPFSLRAIEIDQNLVTDLKTKFENFDFVEIVQADFLDWFPNCVVPDSFKIIGSLPYYITSPIFHTIIKTDHQPDECVFLIQKEVAQKICASDGDSSYMSSFVQAFFDVKIIKVVLRGSFFPIPEVDSAIISLKKKSLQRIDPQDAYKYEKFLHHVYKNPRKMINKVFSDDELKLLDLDGHLRPENISCDKWIDAFFKHVS